MTPFDGAGLFCFYYDGVGTPLTPAEASAYKQAGVDYALIKVSDGMTGGGAVVLQQMQAAWDGGLRVIPYGFFYSTWSGAEQLAILKAAQGGGERTYCADVESAISPAGLAGVGVSTWGNPLPTSLLNTGHPGEPSIGLLADVGVAAYLPQAYGGAWGVSPAQSIAIMEASYRACNLGSLTKPLIPTSDQGTGLLEFAKAAKAIGCNGIIAFRHGANNVSPQSFAGVAEIFTPVTPTPSPNPSPAVLVSGETYQTPKGDLVTFS